MASPIKRRRRSADLGQESLLAARDRLPVASQTQALGGVGEMVVPRAHTAERESSSLAGTTFPVSASLEALQPEGSVHPEGESGHTQHGLDGFLIPVISSRQ